MSEDVIFKPKPFKGFSEETVVYIPCDIPSRLLHKILRKSSTKEQNIGFGYLYLLENKIALFQSLGAPAAVLALESLIISGAKEIILLGFCGSLNPKYKVLDVISVSKALSEEGTSRHYFPQKRIFSSSALLKNRIESTLQALRLPFFTGSVVSTDAPYRETKSWLKEKQRRGIDTVDMEASAVFSLANFYGIQAAALLITTDELWTGKWKVGFHELPLKEKTKEYFFPFIKQGYSRQTQTKE